jgi:hypothetical protein
MPRRQKSAEQLAAIIKKGGRRFLRIFEKARDELALQVLHAYGLQGGVDTLSGHAAPSTQAALGYQLRRIEQTVKEAAYMIHTDAAGVLSTVYLDAVRTAQIEAELSPVASLERLGNPSLHLGMIEAQRQVVVHAFDEALLSSGSFAGRWVNSIHLDAGLRGKVQEAFTAGLFKYDSRKEAADGIFKVLSDAGDARCKEAADAVAGKFIRFGNGSYQDLASYAEMVTDTRMSELYNRAQINMYASEMGYELVQISDHQTDCDICAPFEGTVWALTPGPIGQYRPLSECMNYGPPFHPRCLHHTDPVDYHHAGEGKVRVDGAIYRVTPFVHTDESQAAEDRQQRAINGSPVRVPVAITYRPDLQKQDLKGGQAEGIDQRMSPDQPFDIGTLVR